MSEPSLSSSQENLKMFLNLRSALLYGPYCTMFYNRLMMASIIIIWIINGKKTMLKTSDKKQLNTSSLSLTPGHSCQEEQTGYNWFQCFVVFRLGANAATKRCCLGIKFTLFSKYCLIQCCQCSCFCGRFLIMITGLIWLWD